MNDDRTRIPTEPARVTVGTQLSGIYELDEHLASGGMGEVYRGHNIQTGDLVAIKIVLPEFARDQTILQLFRKEASILNHLSHDAIVRYHVFTIDPVIGRPYLAMEFVNGVSLSDMMQRGPMALVDLGRLGVRLASALAAVHEQHVFHRDLSPDNVILPGGRVERAKIIDFGIAQSTKLGEGTLIGGRFAGKYNYVSPEQLGLFGGEVSEQSDIYSLALLLAAMSRGKPLDMNGSQWEVVEKRRSVPDLSEIDASIRPVLETMLQPDPYDRPANMLDVVDMIAASLPEEAIHTELPRNQLARPPSYPPMAAEAPRPAFVEPVRPAHLDQTRRAAAMPAVLKALDFAPGRSKGRNGLIVVAALAMFAVAGAGVYFSGILEPPPRPVAPPVVIPQPPTGPSSLPVVADEASTDPSTESGPIAHPPISPEPPEKIDAVAERIAWLQSYSGGDCFYAAASSATDSAMEIEGFGTRVEPFMEMLNAFQSRFGMEPNVSVRLIEPAQCPVTDFLRSFGARKAGMPDLVLDRTSVPSGSPVSGMVEAPPEDTVSLLLIDHTGSTFNLSNGLTRQGGRATFSVPIGLSPADQFGGNGAPQVMIAISAGGPISSAVSTKPAKASEVLEAIMAEMKQKGLSGSASAKYFRVAR